MTGPRPADETGLAQPEATGAGRMARGIAAVLVALAAGMGPAGAETLTGSALIRERIALPPGLVFEAVIEDSSRAGAPAIELARTVIQSPGQPPIAFAIDYDPAALRPEAIYTLRVTLRAEGRLIFTTDTVNRVLQEGASGPVEVILKRVAAGSAGATDPGIAANGLALPATFRGTLPCADCEGVRHVLSLWPDGVYQLVREWLGDTQGTGRRDEIGRWRLDPQRGAIVLYGAAEMPLYWQVIGPDRLRQMDMAGAPIMSDLDHELVSDSKLDPADLQSLFLSGHVMTHGEGFRLRECLTGRDLDILDAGAAGDLAAAIQGLQDGKAGSVLVSLEGKITQPPADRPQDNAGLTVLRFVNAFPGEPCPQPADAGDGAP